MFVRPVQSRFILKTSAPFLSLYLAKAMVSPSGKRTGKTRSCGSRGYLLDVRAVGVHHVDVLTEVHLALAGQAHEDGLLAVGRIRRRVVGSRREPVLSGPVALDREDARGAVPVVLLGERYLSVIPGKAASAEPADMDSMFADNKNAAPKAPRTPRATSSCPHSPPFVRGAANRRRRRRLASPYSVTQSECMLLTSQYELLCQMGFLPQMGYLSLNPRVTA